MKIFLLLTFVSSCLPNPFGNNRYDSLCGQDSCSSCEAVLVTPQRSKRRQKRRKYCRSLLRMSNCCWIVLQIFEWSFIKSQYSMKCQNQNQLLNKVKKHEWTWLFLILKLIQAWLATPTYLIKHTRPTHSQLPVKAISRLWKALLFWNSSKLIAPVVVFR